MGEKRTTVPKEAPDDMFQEPCRLLLNQLVDHVAQNRPNGVEPFIGCAYVVEAIVVQKYFLDDEYGHRLAQFRASLHDPETEGDNFRRQEEVDHLRRIILHESANDPQRRQSQVFKRSGFGCRVEERIEEEGDMG